MSEENQKREKFWTLYALHFPNGKRLSRARVLGRSEDNWVVAVNDLHKRRGKVIAECELEHRSYGFVFVTRYDHYGHLDLCRWMRKRGIRGNYTDYLNAIEDGSFENDWDAEDAEEIRSESEISFVLLETNANPDDWEITLTLSDEGEEEVFTL